jgi:CheY-like chemotaxis protein
MVIEQDLFILAYDLEYSTFYKTYNMSLKQFSEFRSGNYPLFFKFMVPDIFSQKISAPTAAPRVSSSSFSPNGANTSKLRILYIDDEPAITKIIKIGLEKFGFIVDVYNRPKEVLSSFRKDVYDLLLIDVRLPEIDGMDLCNELLKIDAKVKVCFITAYDLEEEKVKKRVPALEAECIIKKPISFDALVSKINGQLGENTS